MPIRPPSRPSLTAALEDDWRRLAARPHLVDVANAWALRREPFESLGEVLAAAGYQPIVAPTSIPDARRGAGPGDDPNEVLGRLVANASTDQLAGRTVLQRILPGLRAAARAWWRGCAPAGVAPGDVLDELVAVAWEVIATFPVDRRPRNLAATLVRTAVDRAFVAPSRRRSASDTTREPSTFTSTPDDGQRSPTAELIVLLHEASRHRSAIRDAIALLGDLIAAGGSTAIVAAQRQVTARTIRTRRAHALAHVRDLTLAHPA